MRNILNIPEFPDNYKETRDRIREYLGLHTTKKDREIFDATVFWMYHEMAKTDRIKFKGFVSRGFGKELEPVWIDEDKEVEFFDECEDAGQYIDLQDNDGELRTIFYHAVFQTDNDLREAAE